MLLSCFHPASAVGADLLFASVTKVAGTTINSSAKTVESKIVSCLATGSAPSTILTLLAIAHPGVASKGIATAISLTLGVAFLLSGPWALAAGLR